MKQIQLFAAAGVLGVVSTAFAATPGYEFDFNDGTTMGFFGGGDVNWVASGGVGGAGDGYVSAFRNPAGHLGMANSDFVVTGDLIADGVTGFSFWLKDLGSQAPVNIHVAVGVPLSNFWQCNATFIPSTTEWTQFTIRFDDAAGWTRIQSFGAGTFEEALSASGRLLFRHDLAPYSSTPNSLRGSFGLDRLVVLPEPATGLLVLAAAGFCRRRSRGNC